MKLSDRAGFTLTELVASLLIFSMVIAGLMGIYMTSLRQGTSISTDVHVKAMASYAMRALRVQVDDATALLQPARGTSSSHLEGGANVLQTALTGTNDCGSMYQCDIDGFTSHTRWFHFCVQTVATPSIGCGDPTATPRPLNPAPCLYGYFGPAPGATPPHWPPPAIGDVDCGQVRGGVTPLLLLSGLSGPANGAPNYFTRMNTQKAGELNEVRVSFVVDFPQTSWRRRMTYAVDTTLHGQFGRMN